MNKAFKVIWSEARNAYVVVSEMAKSHGTKSCSTKKLLAMLIATGIMTCASVAPVMAANLAPTETKIEAGNGASASGEGSVAIGNNAQASGLVGIAIGRDAVASGTDSIAIGSDTKAENIFSVAIGNDIKFTAEAGTAVGQQAYASGDNATAIGTMTNVDADWNFAHPGEWRNAGDQSTAIGAYAGSWGIASAALGGFSRADEKFATAIGYDSHATAERATTLGAKAEARAYESVAIGAFSVADRPVGCVGLYAPVGADSLTWKANSGAVSVGRAIGDEYHDEITRQIINVAAGSEDTDAVNVAQLRAATENVNINFEAGNGIVIETVKDDDGTTYKISTNIIGSTTATDTTTVKPSTSSEGGTIGGGTENIVSNLDSNSLPNQPAADNNIQTGDPVKIETVTNPTKFKADEGDAIAISPNQTLGIKGDEKKNITTKADGQNIRVTLNEELDVTKVTADTFDAGATTITAEGLKIQYGPSVTNKGIDAGGKKITNVAPGALSSTSMDAVNGSQLHETNINVANNSMRINKLGDRVNKVGAGAAALAALHPMDFDPDDKWSFAAGMGNYAGQNAAAIGAFYRPDEKVMFSVGGTVGNGENMVNAGISFALDRTNHVSNSRTAMAREILDLRAEVAELKAMVAKGGLGSIAEDKMKIFPDVAENHWAYEYIGKLAAAGIIEGYPDGNFGGDRMMSRYEFAAMLYRAMQNGVQLDSKIINEFAPEMGRIRVDRISGEDGDRDKIERVRVNAVKGERDHYGNKIAKAEAKAK